MPGFNQSGPMGYGPLTGGGRGPCDQTDIGRQKKISEGLPEVFEAE